MSYEQKYGESKKGWEIRLCIDKLMKKCELDWQEIIDLLGLDVSIDHLRRKAHGFLEYDQYLKTDEVATKILCISDLHVPFNLPIKIFENYINMVDILHINGDITDNMSLSKFIKPFRQSIVEELILSRNYIISLIEYLSPKKVVINYGNHDQRLGNYVASHTSDSDLANIIPSSSLDYICITGFTHYNKKDGINTYYKSLNEVYRNSTIEFTYTDNWYNQIGDTIFCHPKAFSSGIMKTSEKALRYFQDTGNIFSNLVMAHTHKIGIYSIGDITLYEQGCCCDTSKIEYANGKLLTPQQEGFLYLCQDEEGNVMHDKTKCVKLKGKIKKDING